MERTGGAPAAAACDLSAPDRERVPLDEGFGDLGSGGGDDTGECRARDAHALCRLSLVEALPVGESQRLEFVQRECDLAELPDGSPAWLEDPLFETARDAAGLDRTWHGWRPDMSI
jgi:hypothetical protein